MSRRNWKAALMGAAMFVTGSARAHDLICSELVNGAEAIVLSQFPTTVQYGIKVTNIHPTSTSILLTAEDPVLTELTMFSFTPTPPVPIPVGRSISDSVTLNIATEEQCFQFAAADGMADGFIDTTLKITFREGSAECSARITCVRSCTPPVPPSP